MSLIARIEDELKEARLQRDSDRRDALSLVLNALRASEKELQRPLSDEEELQVLQRERKRRQEAADAFRAGGRDEQAADEDAHQARTVRHERQSRHAVDSPGGRPVLPYLGGLSAPAKTGPLP
jgi:hypothetical protein